MNLTATNKKGMVKVVLGCKHKWEILKQFNFLANADSKRPHKIVYILTCSKCGKIKKVRIK